jgi:hypothetical protein
MFGILYIERASLGGIYVWARGKARLYGLPLYLAKFGLEDVPTEVERILPSPCTSINLRREGWLILGHLRIYACITLERSEVLTD